MLKIRMFFLFITVASALAFAYFVWRQDLFAAGTAFSPTLMCLIAFISTFFKHSRN